jgi:hypothetical protein
MKPGIRMPPSAPSIPRETRRHRYGDHDQEVGMRLERRQQQFPDRPETQFYGPKRFIGIAPKKLYVADDGFTVTGSYGNQTEVNQNRVVEVDLDAKAISGSGLQDASEFFVQYDFQFVC